MMQPNCFRSPVTGIKIFRYRVNSRTPKKTDHQSEFIYLLTYLGSKCSGTIHPTFHSAYIELVALDEAYIKAKENLKALALKTSNDARTHPKIQRLPNAFKIENVLEKNNIPNLAPLSYDPIEELNSIHREVQEQLPSTDRNQSKTDISQQRLPQKPKGF